MVYRTHLMVARGEDQAAQWIEVDGGYAVRLEGGRVVARRGTRAPLKSLPAAIRDHPAVDRLRQVREWLDRHEADCLATVETWMVRSLEVPSSVIARAWPDPAWRTALADLVVRPPQRPELAGFLRDVSETRGLGVVSLDGETVWLDDALVTIPHPVLLGEIEDFRDFAVDLQVQQGVTQLFRETWAKPGDLAPDQTVVDRFAGREFEQLLHALSRARQLGHPVSGGFAVTRIWEGGRMVEARFWIGSDEPTSPASTGDLSWVDGTGRPLPVVEVGPVAYSEGMRMASAVAAGGSTGEEEE